MKPEDVDELAARSMSQSIHQRFNALEGDLKDIREGQKLLHADVTLCINAVRELSKMHAARGRLATLDDELAEVQRRDTDPAPANGELQEEDTQP